MIIFIDESGVQKKDGQSSVALVYVLVNDVERLNKAVCNQEAILNIQGFHWSKYNWKIRHSFFQSLLKEAFTVKAVLVKNPFSEDVFELAIRQLLTERKVQKIIIDGKKPIRYVLRLKKVLREHHVSVSKIRMGNDLAFPGLRVADAFAGLVRTASEKDNIKARELYELVKIKITTLSGGPVSG